VPLNIHETDGASRSSVLTVLHLVTSIEVCVPPRLVTATSLACDGGDVSVLPLCN
jgi:hypothetical protein